MTDSIRGIASVLRQNMTPAERFLWRALRMKQLGCRFRRQAPIGNYVVDFACFERRLVIEVDGSQHLDNADDTARDAWLRSEGYHVLRFWNDDVMNDINAVVAEIQHVLE